MQAGGSMRAAQEAQCRCHLESFVASCTSLTLQLIKMFTFTAEIQTQEHRWQQKSIFKSGGTEHSGCLAVLLGSYWKPWGQSRWRFYWPFWDSWLSLAWMHANHWKVGQREFVQHISLSGRSRVYGARLAEEGCVTRSIATGRICGFFPPHLAM